MFGPILLIAVVAFVAAAVTFVAGLCRSANHESDDAWVERVEPKHELDTMIFAAQQYEQRDKALRNRVDLEQFMGGEL